MITLRQERPADIEAREALLDEAFGDTRARKTSQRLRDGRLPAEGLSLIAADGRRVVGTARLWSVTCASGQPALLLGPVAVAADCRNLGIGAALVRRALRDARRLGHGAVILVGDAALLRALRLRRRSRRKTQAARPVRAPSSARARARPGSARRRQRTDARDRPSAASAPSPRRLTKPPNFRGRRAGIPGVALPFARRGGYHPRYGWRSPK